MCQTTRRSFLASAGALSGLLATDMTQAAITSVAVTNRAPLAVQPFYLLPTGAVKPLGWLKAQLQIQADGLGGHLDEFWTDVGPESGWLGGSGESWERGPYFLDGLLPLAWQLDNPRLKAKAQAFIDWTLDNPWPNGMIGPKSNDDWWPRMVMLKVLMQYHDLTQDPRVIPVMTGYFHYQLGALPDRPLRDWGRFRWQDELVAVVWLYNLTGDSSLLDLARLLKQQGFDWQGLFADFPFREKVTPQAIGLNDQASGDVINALKDRALEVHGVNNAQGLKASPMWSVVSGQAADRDAIHKQLAELDRYHGLPIGLFSADEHFAGRNPSQGLETCAVVEAMYSLELALAITGNASIGDRIERIAYNALPGAFSEDMWSHQYDQQPNQIKCAQAPGPWTTNGPESNLFGLEPHFGCCTANFHQGWPKLTSSLWMATADGGLAAMLYAPSEVMTQVRGVSLRATQTTEYPFRDRVSLTISPQTAIRFPLRLRRPDWASAVHVKVNGGVVKSTATDGFITLDRQWRPDDKVDIVFDASTRFATGFDDSLIVEHGALLYVLPVGEDWRKLRDHTEKSADWEVWPTTLWNYGLSEKAVFKRSETAIGRVPFATRAPPVQVTVPAYVVVEWKTDEAFAPPPPRGLSARGGLHTVTLIPYGAAKLRITSFPKLLL
jgi:hypothetical protein